PRDAVPAAADARRAGRRARRADATELRRALAHLDLRGCPRGTLARAPREAHPAGTDEAAGILLGSAAAARERARRLGDRLHAGVGWRAPGRRVREGLVAQAVPRRARG